MAGIYVHVPFCHAKCAYCDFYSLANTRFMRAYTDAVIAEWNSRKSEIGEDSVRTLYFGGGTPSILKPEDFQRIATVFPTEHLEEFTIEVNPEDVNPDRVLAWKAVGVNRVSMGVQSLVDEELKFVGRRHSSVEALEAIDCLRAGGICNISCDLIYGLPMQTLDSWVLSLDTLLDKNIQHLSAYCLSYEPGTRLTMKRDRGEIMEADEELIADMYGMLCEKAAQKDFSHCEISNFALPGFHSRHNSSYWNSTPYLGLGPGAHSLGADGVRRYVPSDIKAYVAHPAEAAVVDEEDEIDRFNDLILISLRTAHGMALDAVPSEYLPQLVTSAKPHITAGRLTEVDGRLIIPEEQWLISDMVIRDLFR